MTARGGATLLPWPLGRVVLAWCAGFVAMVAGGVVIGALVTPATLEQARDGFDPARLLLWGPPLAQAIASVLLVRPHARVRWWHWTMLTVPVSILLAVVTLVLPGPAGGRTLGAWLSLLVVIALAAAFGVALGIVRTWAWRRDNGEDDHDGRGA